MTPGHADRSIHVGGGDAHRFQDMTGGRAHRRAGRTRRNRGHAFQALDHIIGIDAGKRQVHNVRHGQVKVAVHPWTQGRQTGEDEITDPAASGQAPVTFGLGQLRR